ncbi:MBL fold metallo-hydrolase [Streptomyces sp. NPDC020667]|uniref:hypothetical protein n=1 Tax=Streptomyces sp. NPDC020667 TaxID=3154895 RepID=UPI0033F39DC7
MEPIQITSAVRQLTFPVGHVDREEAVATFRRLAALEVETVCVPHGEPLLKDGGTALRAATPESDWL